ncbi:peptidase dimerization domain-containing protein [Dactylosporangium siamense]|uniref:Peptidase M20 dimerisation domain-containing protein n=1 Tax=Dactylosporangium siamense TaxID=685454 RepID=A0A919U8B1_9ACTN|nr:peptidase dimerization domain-containing protein [Dactylosporangium siamense]GIG42595.1 hypothetical protein Dsi01nite_006360 [Dactylosporangium siamense]
MIRVDEALVRTAVTALVDTASPTGRERPLADRVVGLLREHGLDGRLQDIDAEQANAYAVLRGSGDGPALLLYAPIDTLTTGEPEHDLPWIGPVLRPDHRPRAVVDGDLVTGLGAGNPKGHAAAVLAAGVALAAGPPLPGTVIVAFGAGGMPGNALPGSARANTGQGAGCSFLLERGVHADHAVIAKPGTGVLHEEVGLAWFDVVTHGTHTYAGSRHLLPYRNAIAAAAAVVDALERWFPRYTARHTDGQVAPQGIVAAIDGGWRRLAAVTPAACRIRVDLRLSPRTTPSAAHRELAAAVRAVDPDATVEMVLSIPGTRTDPGAPVVEAAVDAWQAEHGRAHTWPVGLSGATDANILRARGIPTARVGMAKVPGTTDFALGMNTVSLTETARLARLLVRVAAALCAEQERMWLRS